MSKLRSVTAVASALAVMGCASVVPERPAGPFVVPTQAVRHGMDADAHYRTGRYFQGQVRYEQAIEAYQRVLATQPGHVDALNALGVIYSLQGQPALAEQAFKLALQADPQAARVHNNLGYHLLQNGRGAEAIVAFERARELEPGNADTQANLASARAALGLPGQPAVAAVVADAAPIPSARSAPAAIAVAPPLPAVTVAATVAATDVRAAPAHALPVALDRVADGVWTLGSASGKPAPAAAPATAVNPATRTGLQAAADPAAGTADVAAPAGRVEISNGNGATGLARRVSGFVAPASALRPRLTNDKPYGVRASRIQYVAGSERLAQEVNARLPSPLPLARAGTLERDVRVRVLLGKDFPQPTFATELSTRRNS